MGKDKMTNKLTINCDWRTTCESQNDHQKYIFYIENQQSTPFIINNYSTVPSVTPVVHIQSVVNNHFYEIYTFKN